MDYQQQDNQELTTATENFQKCCLNLNMYLDKERKAEEAYLEKQKRIRLAHWGDAAAGVITQSLFEKIIKNECFPEEIEWKKCKTIRRQEENRKDSLKEALYTTKLKLKLQ